MRRPRWLAPWKDSPDKPAIYHCISRVVDRQFVLGDLEREKFRTFMRMQENFSGCRILSYCIMSNHFHLLLEVPPMPKDGLSDDELLKRLSALKNRDLLATVTLELKRAREAGNDDWAAAIHARYTYRMHSLSEYMKTLLQRFTQWFNRVRERKGTLWEQRYKSVIVESGTAARTMAAYIDLNPVRAGIVSDPAKYRWSSYGEAIGGGPKGNGKKAREGLVRACLSQRGVGFDAEKWKEVSRIYRELLGMALERKGAKNGSTGSEATGVPVRRRGRRVVANQPQEDDGGIEGVLPELSYAEMLLHQIRYFSDGAVIGSKAFVDEVFQECRERFSDQRESGARPLKGRGSAARGVLWSIRDLRVGVD